MASNLPERASESGRFWAVRCIQPGAGDKRGHRHDVRGAENWQRLADACISRKEGRSDYEDRRDTLQSACGFTPIGHQRLKSLLVAATAMIKRTAGG